MQEAEEELGKLPATALVKELKEANQDRKNVLIKVRLISKNYKLSFNKISFFHIYVVSQVACTVYSTYSTCQQCTDPRLEINPDLGSGIRDEHPGSYF
jgi:hypothetical protein